MKTLNKFIIAFALGTGLTTAQLKPAADFTCADMAAAVTTTLGAGVYFLGYLAEQGAAVNPAAADHNLGPALYTAGVFTVSAALGARAAYAYVCSLAQANAAAAEVAGPRKDEDRPPRVEFPEEDRIPGERIGGLLLLEDIKRATDEELAALPQAHPVVLAEVARRRRNADALAREEAREFAAKNGKRSRTPRRG